MSVIAVQEALLLACMMLSIVLSAAVVALILSVFPLTNMYMQHVIHSLMDKVLIALLQSRNAVKPR